MDNRTLVFATVICISALTGCRSGGTITPRPIQKGFGFPGSREEIQAWTDNWQIDRITAKAWNLWAGLTARTDQTWQGGTLPVWETWCGTKETFDKECHTLNRPSRQFINAAQLSHAATGIETDLRLVAFNKYNPAMADYIAAMHPGPGDADYDYTQQASLAALNSAWPRGTPIAARKVQETPYIPGRTAAIEIKPVMFLVKQNRLTAVPLWKGSDNSDAPNCQGVTNADSPGAVDCHPNPATWMTCALVDPAQAGANPATPPQPATREQIDSAATDTNFSCKHYLYAPISTIYHMQMDRTEATAFNKVQAENGMTAEAGDFAVLTAMHVSTKEIANWTWQTFWWQPGEDPPGNYPGSKNEMTDQVEGEWRNYASCTAYNQTQGTTSGQIQVCFNPYLETSSSIPDGLQSNCMSCHGTATVKDLDGKPPTIQTLSYPSDYKTPINFNEDPMFAGYTRTDFAWSIPSNSHPPQESAK